MKHIITTVLLSSITLSLLGCSGGAPSSSVVEEKALNYYKNMVPSGNVKVVTHKCEPTSTEKQYDCYVKFDLDGKDTDARKYTFTQANGNWSITSGGYGFPRAKYEQLGF